MDPEFLAVIVTLGGGATLGAIGYVVRSLHGWWVAKQDRRADLAARLHGLATLLHTSGSLFDVQAGQRNRLSDILKRNHPNEISLDLGYDATFQQLYDHFTAEEAELDGIVRAMTEFGLRPVNKAISEWLERDTIFKTGMSPMRGRQNLALWLHQLELHLTLWHAKYEYWMPDRKHALVYLADEEAHGVGFPNGVESVVEEALEELGQPTLATIPVPTHR